MTILYTMDPFENIYGHKEIINSLSSSVDGLRLHHALLFSGIEGTGKRSVAIALAKKLLAVHSSNPSRVMQRVENGTHEDLIIVTRDWAVKNPGSTIKVDAIRELENRVVRGPFESSSLVVILDSMEHMTPASSNALLKTLEEPPAGTYIILLSSSSESVLPTIRSRCHAINFPPLEEKILRDYAEDHFNNEDSELKEAALTMCQGSIGVMKDFLTDVRFRDVLDITERMFKTVISGNMTDVISDAETASSFETDYMYKIFNLFEYRIALAVRSGLSGRKPEPDFNYWMEFLEKSSRDIHTNINKKLFFEHLLWTLRRS